MRPIRSVALSFALVSLALVGCSQEELKPVGAPPPVSAPPAASQRPTGGSPYLLAADPTGGLSVLDAKAAAPRAGVVVVGRVKEITTGYAAFTLTDVSLKYCGEAEAEGCPTPWDYCCTPNDQIAAATIGVIVPGLGDEPEKLGKIPDFRNADLVVVTGDLVKDADGNPRLHAKGWFRRERPKLPDTIVFPE